ncbi:MAG: hypothetical protein Q7S37_03550 [bacterium]|nr:hypothetical protein [bacterium]
MNNYPLIRLLLSHLGSIHSAAGVNLGRSIRSGLRETMMMLMPFVDSEEYRSLVELDTGELIDEAQRRDFEDTVVQLELKYVRSETSIHAFTDEWLLEELVYYLQDWYDEDSLKEDPLAYDLEREIVEVIANMVPPPITPAFGVVELEWEVKERWKRRDLLERGPIPLGL